MATIDSGSGRSADTRGFVKLTVGFVIIYLVLDRSAAWTNSLYGEYGWLIFPLVVATALLIERLLFGRSPRQALRALGFGRPRWRGLLAALLASLVLLAYFPIVALVSGQPLTLREGWPWVALGVLLQGGIAEELLWRGYLFRHLRARRSFWRAAALAMIYMVAQHTLLLWQLPLPIAIAALVVALLSSFPLAHLFEASGNTVWAPALLHCVIQGALKVVVVPEAALLPAQLGWMSASVVLPYLVFLVQRADRPPQPAQTVRAPLANAK
jgi:membrane protease YdiL (CAAX protease family)